MYGQSTPTPSTVDASAGRAAWGSCALESLAVFFAGVALMQFIYAGTGGALSRGRGVPGNDSFYHIKMAAMMPEHGLLDTFPWLRFTYFQKEGDAFVSHHYGFHLLIAPFVHASHAWTGDYLPGARWAMSTFFGLNLMLFNLLLISERVRWRWLWLFLFFLLPSQFFTRHSFIRAIGPSLMFMQLILLLMFRRRFVPAALAIACYTHLYLGAVLYAPVLVGLYAFSMWIGPREGRAGLWRLVALTAGGWMLGVLTYPYVGGMLGFLKLQVFGSGLSPDIPVGREWKPYEGVWWFAQMAGPLLIVWSVALCARLRLGHPANAKELALMLMSLVFLGLTLKARRFVEYFPLFCLLSAALLSVPLIDGLTARFDQLFQPLGDNDEPWTREALSTLIVIAIAAILFWNGHRLGLNGFLVEWRLWSAATALYLLVPLSSVWRRSASNEGRAGPPLGVQALRSLRVVAFGAAFLGATYCFPSEQLLRIQRVARCKYDLPAIAKAMSFLEKHSDPGDVVFTDDWDIFPVFFYYNTHNHYIVGLDPKFTHHRRPDLWQRYVKVSRGQVPADTSYTTHDASGKEVKTRIHVKLEDIREHFGARFAVTDRDHKPLAAKLAAAGHFAELIYPSTSYRQSRDKPYLIFRIRESDEAHAGAAPATPPPDENGVLYLSFLAAQSVEQGFGEFITDRSVEGGPIHLDKVYTRGLGTHTPSKLLYAIPEGYDTFEATVGVNRSTRGRGSIVASIHLDGERVFTTPVLTGTSQPVVVRVPVAGAKQLLLQADPTDDGKRFDHVDWAGARFVRTPDDGS